MIHIKHSTHVGAQLLHGAKGSYYNLLIRFSLCGKRKNFSLGVSVPTYQWDPVGKCFAPGAQNSEEARRIMGYCSMLEEIVSRFELVEQRVPSMDEVCEAFDKARGVERKVKESHLVYDVMLQFVYKQSEQKGWAEGTVKKFWTMRKHFHDYRPDLTLEDISLPVLEDFFRWLGTDRKVMVRGKERVISGLINSTLQKYVKFVRWFLNWCEDEGLYKLGAQHDFAPKYRGGDNAHKDIIYLTADELKAVMTFEASPDQFRLAHVRDMFIFSCFTGLRYSDVASLRWSQVSESHISVVTVKTGDRLQINLNQYSRALLDRYRGHEYPGGVVFPPLSNQKANIYLHELCRECGIVTETLNVFFKGTEKIEQVVPKCDLVTFHSGRRSFITHAFRLGVPLPVIMKFSGHHSARMLKVYMDIADDLKAIEMSKFDNF